MGTQEDRGRAEKSVVRMGGRGGSVSAPNLFLLLQKEGDILFSNFGLLRNVTR